MLPKKEAYQADGQTSRILELYTLTFAEVLTWNLMYFTHLNWITTSPSKKLERKVEIDWFDSRNVEMVATSWKVSSLASASSVRSVRG